MAEQPSKSEPHLSSAHESWLERMRSSYFTLARTADVMARDAPPRLRPLVRAAVVGGASLMFVAMMPFLPLIWWKQTSWLRKHKRDVSPVSALEEATRHLWTATSPQVAVDTIRDVFEQCRSAPQGIVVEPFGRFVWSVCDDALADLLYRYEAELGHWDKALEISDLMLAGRRNAEAIFPRWTLSRAKSLVRLGRESEALALLMAHRDMYNPNAPVNQYLERVRAGRG